MHAGFSQLSRISLVALFGSFFSLSSQVAPATAVAPGTAAPTTALLISPADKAALEKYIKEHSGFDERTKDQNKNNQSSSKKKYWVAGGVTLLVAAIILIWYLKSGKKALDPAAAAVAASPLPLVVSMAQRLVSRSVAQQALQGAPVGALQRANIRANIIED
jgi:hypothetical protein